MGVLAVGIGKVEEAHHFPKTLEANPSIEQFWLSYIDALIQLGRIGEAKEMFIQARKENISGNVLISLIRSEREKQGYFE